jgi:copper-containing nitrite reductase
MLITSDSRMFAPIAFLLILLFGSAGYGVAQSMRGMNGLPAPRHGTLPVVDITRNPADVPPAAGNRPAATVKIDLTAREVVGELDPATQTTYRYWTFNGKVPGPMIRVRQGDAVEVTLHNDPNSHMAHSLDFHAAIGPGGGAALSQVLPGQQKTFTFQATTPGLFVYHCGTPMISDHIANGMYGLILVEPPGGLPEVDREYYVMQGEIYTAAPKGKSGLQAFSEADLMKESPEYFVFNGAVDSLTRQHPLQAEVGQTVRIFFGNAGPNATSSFHVVGEIFTRDYQLGSLSSPLEGVQTASVPAGGAAILELKSATAGQFSFMDHAMARMAKGLLGTLNVSGEQVAQLMHAGPATVSGSPKTTVSGMLSSDDLAGTGADLPLPVTADASQAAEGLSHAHSAMHSIHSARKLVSGTAPAHSSMQERKTGNGASVAELYGCFVIDGVPKIRLFHSSKSYDLEPRTMLLRDSPLAFALSMNKLVHITGHVDRAAHSYGDDWFVVETITPLASSCNTTLSPAEVRGTAKHHLEEVSATSSGTVVIGMGDMSFTSPNVTISAGQTVVWQNTSGTVHNVIDDAAQAVNAADIRLPLGVQPFGSGYLQPGQTYQRTFTIPGVYRYVCTLHESGGMKGTIVVRASRAVHMAKAEAPNGR